MERSVTIFFSSPGDLRPERAAAQRVVNRLRREFAAHFTLRTTFWERKALRATSHFQDQIPFASQADVVVVILWTTLGTVLPHPQFAGAITAKPVTGTVFEFEDGVAGFNRQGRPEILTYRKVKSQVTVDLRDRQKVLALYANQEQVDRFFTQWFGGDQSGEFKRAFREFMEVDELEEMLTLHLRDLLVQRVHEPGLSQQAPPEWYRGSPYRGLLSFEVGDAEVFFGRTRARGELREVLVRQIGDGYPVVAVVGASGTGKSSLVKAGLLPDLKAPGMIDDVGLCQHAIVRPSTSGGNLIAPLARALLEDTALVGLASQRYDEASLEALLRKSPELVVIPLKNALGSAATAAGLLRHATARLALIVDQAEELFTSDVPEGELDCLAAAIDALLQSGAVWVLITLRSDFLPQFESAPALRHLANVGARYLLKPPTDGEIDQMIRGPAVAAGLEFEFDATSGLELSQELRVAATRSPSGLPLLEFSSPSCGSGGATVAS